MNSEHRTRVVVADPLARDGIDWLEASADVLTTNGDDDLRAALPSSEALIVRSRTRVTEAVLDWGPDLRLVGRAGIGIDNIDVDAASARGVLVINAPMGNVRSTAEHTIGLIFALARRLIAADEAVRSGLWKAGYEGLQLAGRRLGVIGAGKVGREVAAIASVLGMDVAAHDPYLPESAWAALGLIEAPLHDLLAQSDFVTIHVPLADETRNMIDTAALSLMKQGSYLINCARGGLVDEIALAGALDSGHLGGAALDVYEREPLADSPLLTCPNLILTPHVAASTREAQARVSLDIAIQVVDFFAGRAVGFPINPQVLGEV